MISIKYRYFFKMRYDFLSNIILFFKNNASLANIWGLKYDDNPRNWGGPRGKQEVYFPLPAQAAQASQKKEERRQNFIRNCGKVAGGISPLHELAVKTILFSYTSDGLGWGVIFQQHLSRNWILQYWVYLLKRRWVDDMLECEENRTMNRCIDNSNSSNTQKP